MLTPSRPPHRRRRRRDLTEDQLCWIAFGTGFVLAVATIRLLQLIYG